MKSTLFFISCEHAVNNVPPEFQSVFKGHEAVLETHRGIDFGAKTVATHLYKTLQCEHVFATATRLLIDCNRSLNNKQCFSEFSRDLPQASKERLINHYYLPYRGKVEQLIKANIDKGYQVLHISVHSFTPVFENEIRNAGIGLLYDPTHHGEKEVARQWQGLLVEHIPAFRIRLNYPYQGASDGFTTYLRNKYSQKDYLGIELEMNQSLVQKEEIVPEIARCIGNSLIDLKALL